MPRSLLAAAAALLLLAAVPSASGQNYGLSEPGPGGATYSPPTTYQPAYQPPYQPIYQPPYQPPVQPAYQPPRTSYYPPTNPPGQSGGMPPGAVPHYRQGPGGQLIPDGYTLNGVKYPQPGNFPSPGVVPPVAPPIPNNNMPRPGDATMGVSATMLFGNGLRIDGVFPGGTAAQMGLERGDIIMGVNGTAVRDITQFRDLLNRSGGSLNLTVRNVRNGQVIPVNGFLNNGSSGPGIYAAPAMTP